MSQPPGSSNSGRKKNTRRNNGNEQKFVFNHYTTDSAAHRSGHGFISPNAK
jgi:hypothetical protein